MTVRVVGAATGFRLKVTVKSGFGSTIALQGFVVPEHVEEERLDCPLQPANVDPAEATALKVTVAPLTVVEMLGRHVVETVWNEALLPVPPQAAGALT